MVINGIHKVIQLSIKVIPNAAQSKIVLDANAKICVYVKSQPEKGKANKELIDLISKKLAISKGDISIISGLGSRYKKIAIHKPLTYAEVLFKLGLEVQKRVNI